ncbi:YdeI/OmpD-associated family protein [Niabella ginsengisoli]|uniref:YdeI/OmpD-associated family protein n=1 Tax=Niabella ginsengisoli TaxID=522298 RepID=A0ABS9SIQ6_9BACT|nr:YdeI/OmpD-associated family protein [Niabella ginsengisoli]MCH5598210.1 YdeI/OmpD-associated family protein [Niabella ginsengisoli]
MAGTNSKVDFYFNKENKWQNAIQQLRNIALDCGLQEELKWGCPCYTFNGSNIVLIHEFKEYCAYLFFKGVLLQDPEGILIQQTKNVQVARQIRFTSVEAVNKQKKILKTYIYEAITIEEAGLTVSMKKTKEFDMPEEFLKKLKEKPMLKKAFEALTPGRQRAYLLYFSQAKQATTREARIEKSEANIMQGKGLND